MGFLGNFFSKAASAMGFAQPEPAQTAEATAGPAAVPALATAPIAVTPSEPAGVPVVEPMAMEPPTAVKSSKIILALALQVGSPQPSPPPSPKISQYERERNARIKRNEEFLASLGLGTVKLSAAQEAAREQAREELRRLKKIRSEADWARHLKWLDERPERRDAAADAMASIKRQIEAEKDVTGTVVVDDDIDFEDPRDGDDDAAMPPAKRKAVLARRQTSNRDRAPSTPSTRLLRDVCPAS